MKEVRVPCCSVSVARPHGNICIATASVTWCGLQCHLVWLTDRRRLATHYHRTREGLALDQHWLRRLTKGAQTAQIPRCSPHWTPQSRKYSKLLAPMHVAVTERTLMLELSVETQFTAAAHGASHSTHLMLAEIKIVEMLDDARVSLFAPEVTLPLEQSEATSVSKRRSQNLSSSSARVNEMPTG